MINHSLVKFFRTLNLPLIDRCNSRIDNVILSEEFGDYTANRRAGGSAPDWVKLSAAAGWLVVDPYEGYPSAADSARPVSIQRRT